LPFTPRMVTVTSLPIITVSPTRLVNMSISSFLLGCAAPGIGEPKDSD
jgi:hypothetical protein